MNLDTLKNEYKSNYLNYWNKDNPLLNFREWLKVKKGIIIIKL